MVVAETPPRSKNKKRLAWAVEWIDEMIANVRDGTSFDETLEGKGMGRY